MSIITNYLKNKYNLSSDERIIYELIDVNDYTLSSYILKSSEISPEMLTKCYNRIQQTVYGGYHDFLISEITSNPNCPKSVMNNAITMIKNREKNVSLYNSITLYNILKSANMDREMFRKIYENFDLYDFAEKYRNEIFHLVYANPFLESIDLEKYYYIINNRNRAVAGVDNIYEERMRYYHVLSNIHCSKTVFDGLCKDVYRASVQDDNNKFYSSDVEIRAALNNPKCPLSYLSMLVKSGKFACAMFHPNFSENVFTKFDGFGDYIKFPVKLNYDRLKKLIPYCYHTLITFVISSLITSPELLEEIYDKRMFFMGSYYVFRDHDLVRDIFKNPCASIDLRLKMYYDYPFLASMLVEISNCPKDILTKWWNNGIYREKVLLNPNCPINILLDLLDKGYSNFFEKRQELMKLIINNNHFTLRILLDNWDYFAQETIDNDFKELLNKKIIYLLTKSSEDKSLTDEDICKLYRFYNPRINKVESNLAKRQKQEELKAKMNNFFGLTNYSDTANNSQKTPSDVGSEKTNDIGNIDNAKTQVVKGKLQLISELIPFYYGNKELLKEARNLVAEYNRRVNQIHESKKAITLSFANEKNAQPLVSDLYSSLINDLDSILKMLEECKKIYQKYEGVLGYIDKILKVLSVNQDGFDDLSNDILLIKTKALPFVAGDSYREELKQIFESEKKYIVDYFKGNIDKLDYDSLDEFKVHIRNKLMIYLMKLDVSVKDKYDINKIKLEFLSGGLDIFVNDREKHNMHLLKEIRGIIHNIELYGNKGEKDKLKEILNDVEYADKLNIESSLLALFNDLYKVYLDIECRMSDLIAIEEDDFKQTR